MPEKAITILTYASSYKKTPTLQTDDKRVPSPLFLDGRFGNKTEVVRAGLILLEDYENMQKAIRVLVNEGYDDIRAGRVTQYSSAKELFNDIMEDE